MFSGMREWTRADYIYATSFVAIYAGWAILWQFVIRPFLHIPSGTLVSQAGFFFTPFFLAWLFFRGAEARKRQRAKAP